MLVHSDRSAGNLTLALQESPAGGFESMVSGVGPGAQVLAYRRLVLRISRGWRRPALATGTVSSGRRSTRPT